MRCRMKGSRGTSRREAEHKTNARTPAMPVTSLGIMIALFCAGILVFAQHFVKL
jgi:hypothetical protein